MERILDRALLLFDPLCVTKVVTYLVRGNGIGTVSLSFRVHARAHRKKELVCLLTRIISPCVIYDSALKRYIGLLQLSCTPGFLQTANRCRVTDKREICQWDCPRDWRSWNGAKISIHRVTTRVRVICPVYGSAKTTMVIYIYIYIYMRACTRA